MSKRSRPQPITAPAPESFLPSFDFGSSPKQKSSAPLPPRKPLKLTKRLAAFTFLNLEDIVEEGAAANGDSSSPPLDPLSPANVYSPISTGGRTNRFWDFTRNKHSNQSSVISPVSPASLPPMSSKAYATLVGGPTTPGSKPIWTPPASRVIRRQDEFGRSDSITSEIIELEAPTAVSPAAAPAESTAISAPADKEVTSPKTLAVDLVSIFSLSTSDEAEKTRFSFPMPPSFTPRRGSQSPLDPDMSFTSLRGSISSAVSPLSPLSPDSIGSTRSDLSFLSPLFSPTFVDQMFLPDIIDLESSVAPDDTKSIAASVATTSPKRSSRDGARKARKRRSTRPVSLLPPAGPPPRESPPPTPTTPSSFISATASLRPEPAIRACPSPDLDPELSSASSIHSVLQASDASASSESEPEETASVKVQVAPTTTSEKAYDGLFANWGFGAPSRSDSIVTITQRAYNAMRTSISNASSPRNGSWGSAETYDNWDKAIDEIFTLGLASRKPSLASIAIAASADGAASANTTLDMVESMAFVMDDEMRRKLMESQFLVPSRVAPVPPVPSSPKPDSVFSHEGTPSGSATSSARSSMDEDRSFPLPEPVTPLQDTLDELEHALGIEEDPLSPIVPITPKLTTVPQRPKPTPLITSRTYPPVSPLRIVKNAPPSSFRAPTTKPSVHPVTPTATHNPTLSPIERPPPMQGVPDEDPSNAFSPLSGLRSPAVDIDSWPEWSPMDVDVALERRKAKHQSSSAATMISKFSDDSVEIRLPKSSGRRKLKSNAAAAAMLSPGSSHTSYTFLGLKKKKDSSSPTSGSPPKGFPPLPKDAAAKLSSANQAKEKEAAPRVSVESAASRASSDSKKNGLKRPPLPVELFIRA